jgi:hypothetical protein
MPLQSYTDLVTALGNWLQRSDITALFPNFIQLFEAEANRRLRVRQQEALLFLTPQVIATVTGAAAASPTGVVRLTTSPLSAGPGTIATGDQVAVAGVSGTTEANGTFLYSPVDDTHVDLLGTTFSHAYAGGGTLTATGTALLPPDYLAWRRVTWLGNPQRDLDYVHPSMLVRHYPGVPIDRPVEFTIERSILRVMPRDPTPLLFLYFQQIPSLATNTANWLMSQHPDLYLFGALTEAQAYTVNAETAALWKARRDELFDEIEQLSNKTRGPAAVRTTSPTP